MNSGEGFCEGFTMHLFTETCKKSLQHSILLWAFECNECSFQQALQVHISSAVSPFFLSSSFSCQRSWKDDPESVQKYHSSVETCTPAAVHSELVTLWSQALCSVISGKEVLSSSHDAGGFGDSFSQLQLVFGACGDGWFGAFSKFPSFLQPAQLSSVREDMISVPEHPALVLHCQLCSALHGNRGFNLQPRGCTGYPHTHPCADMAQILILRSLGQRLYLGMLCYF